MGIYDRLFYNGDLCIVPSRFVPGIVIQMMNKGNIHQEKALQNRSTKEGEMDV